MTVRKILTLIDDIRPNTATEETKLSWICTLEKIIIDYMTMYSETDTKYSSLTVDSETALGDEYANMYAYYGVYMLDLKNMDISMYNNSLALFNTLFVSWQKKWRREHLPQNIKRGDS